MARAPRGSQSTVSLARPRADHGHVLLVRLGDRLEVVPVTGDEAIVGRDAACEVSIEDEAISRRHARIRFGSTITVEDLGSRNGTFVAGARLRSEDEVELRLHEALVVAGVQIFVEPAPSPGEKLAGKRKATTRDGIVLRDPKMAQLYAVLEVVAASPLRVLVLGETGVGKDVFARALHARSPRAARPYLALNCAALGESTLEGELFGYEKGAFTGAVQAKPGLFEAADGGTVFLDEVGELPPSTQAKLLRVLESGEVLRLGSLAPRTIDVRIISATNRDLRARVADGSFRADLYFRLDGTTLRIPPLRERIADIEPLAVAFAGAIARDDRAPPRLLPDAIAALEAHGWPGNVRELKNVVERAVVMRRGEPVRAADLELCEPWPPPPDPEAPGRRSPPSIGAGRGDDLWSELELVERRRIVEVLAQTGGNQTAAAKLLGIARATLIKRIERFDLTRPKKR